MNFSIFLPYLNAVPINLVPGYFAHILKVERIEIIAKLHFQVTFSLPSLSSLLKLPKDFHSPTEREGKNQKEK